MTLHVVQPPAATLRVARTVLGRLSGGTGFLTRGALAASSRDDLWLSAPHPVFNIGVDDIERSDAIARTRMTGWRFFVLSGGRAVATMELAASRRRDAGRFARLTDGRMAASSARAIARAEAGTLTSGGGYALGMVRVPALGVSALWLRDRDQAGRHDLFAPVGSVPAQMTAERWLPSAAFMQMLQLTWQAAQSERVGER
jgi:hypothetical protein